MIIIGILAAIAIPVYIGVQNSAKDSQATSDLANAKVAVNAYVSANNGTWSPISATASDNSATAPVSGKGGFGNYGWSSLTAVDDSSTAGGSASAWCIKQISTSSASTVFYVTPTSAPTSTKPSGCV